MCTSDSYLVFNEPRNIMCMGYCDNEQRIEKNKGCVERVEEPTSIIICVRAEARESYLTKYKLKQYFLPKKKIIIKEDLKIKEI